MASRGLAGPRGGIWEAVIGLEVHAQLSVRSKLFSRASSGVSEHTLGQRPNGRVSCFDASFPGTLPTINAAAVDQAIRAGLALQCEINRRSLFERKHYSYCDLPHGYQITQQRFPVASGGRFCLSKDVSIRVNRIQLETDSGKSLHTQQHGQSLVDLNRAGCALMEIVMEPDIRGPQQAGDTLKALQQLLRHIGSCDGNMEDGSLRCDLNVSVRPIQQPQHGALVDEAAAGERVEIKNMASIKSLVLAAQFEAERQVALVEGEGGRVVQETRTFDLAAGVTRRTRQKEQAADYLFFPEPDLPPLVLETDRIKALKESLPELPEETLHRLTQVHGLSSYQAGILLNDAAAIAFYEDVLSGGRNDRNPKEVAKWLCNDLFGLLNSQGQSLGSCAISPEDFGSLLDLLAQGEISTQATKTLLEKMFQQETAAAKPVSEWVRELGLGRDNVQQDDSVSDMCKQIVQDPKNEAEVLAYRAGKTNVLKVFMGQAMKSSKGRADGRKVRAFLVHFLGEAD